MRTITRRELNHSSGKILDEILATGEPVEVVTRGAPSLVISRLPESAYERWKRLGLVKGAVGRLSDAPVSSSPRSIDEMLADIESDH